MQLSWWQGIFALALSSRRWNDMMRRFFMPARRNVIAGLAATLAMPARAAQPGTIAFADLYESAGAAGLKISPKLQALDGLDVAMRGYMAPPLKPESDFFVLTRFPMSICPFCSSEADWPADIVVIYLSKAAATLSPSQVIRVAGRLETGAKMDPGTAFVSLVRIVEAEWRVV